MDLVALQAGPINSVVTKCISNVSQIKAKITNSMYTLITLLCNTTFASVNTSVRPRVKVSQRNIDESFLYDTGAQRTCMPFKAFKRIYMFASPVEVCFPKLVTKRDKTGRDWRPFPNGQDRVGTTSLWSCCSGKFGKNSGRDLVPLGTSLEWS